MRRDEFETYRPWMAVADGVEESRREALVRRLGEMGEYYAAGFFEEAGSSLYRRYGLGLKRLAEGMPVMGWEGSLLFPATGKDRGQCCDRLWEWRETDVRRQPVLRYHYNRPWSFDWGAYEAKKAAVGSDDRWALDEIVRFQREWMVGAGEPLGDSFGAYQGRDKFGPTALLNSVTSVDHTAAVGTLVVNTRFSREMLSEAGSRRKLQKLLETYFARGGMQVQLTVVDQKVLEAAMANPEGYADLVVRIGGYSAYFNDLSVELKRSVLERSIHDV